MAPKMKFRPGFLMVNPEVLVTVAERRARIAARQGLPAPVPAAASGPYSAPASSSASASTAPTTTATSTATTLHGEQVLPGRSDFAAIRYTRRGGRATAVRAIT